jgi:DNA-directed RNA polymerase subunit RPC12/RpoP
MIRYACLKCGATVASLARPSAECSCGNLRIEDGRVALQDISRFRAVIEVLQSAVIGPMLPAWRAGIPVDSLED